MALPNHVCFMKNGGGILTMINEAKTFAKIFEGMTRSFITKDKDNNYETIDRDITLEDYQNHIQGNLSIGVEPRNDRSKCRFSLLDFD